MTMTGKPFKESIFDIEPWHEQPSTIPSCLLNPHHFAKTSYPSQHRTRDPPLTIATNPVYVIKNHEETQQHARKTKQKYHRTAESSPKFRHKPIDKLYSPHQKEVPVISTVRSTSRLLKRRQKNPEVFSSFQHTKNLIFEVRNPKKMGEEGRKTTTWISHNKQGREAFNSNLLRIYERSTLTNDQKRQLKLHQADIDQICQRRKLKTEKEREDPSALQENNRVPIITEHGIHGRLGTPKLDSVDSALPKQKVQASEKLKIELLMERKLFVLKSNMQTCPNRARPALSLSRH